MIRIVEIREVTPVDAEVITDPSPVWLRWAIQENTYSDRSWPEYVFSYEEARVLSSHIYF